MMSGSGLSIVEQVDLLIPFFEMNADFFAAPFIRKERFSHWVQRAMTGPIIQNFSNRLLPILEKRFAALAYVNAISGVQYADHEELVYISNGTYKLNVFAAALSKDNRCLVHHDVTALRKLLMSQEELRQFFLAEFANTDFSNSIKMAIEEWYQAQPSGQKVKIGLFHPVMGLSVKRSLKLNELGSAYQEEDQTVKILLAKHKEYWNTFSNSFATLLQRLQNEPQNFRELIGILVELSQYRDKRDTERFAHYKKYLNRLNYQEANLPDLDKLFIISESLAVIRQKLLTKKNNISLLALNASMQRIIKDIFKIYGVDRCDQYSKDKKVPRELKNNLMNVAVALIAVNFVNYKDYPENEEVLLFLSKLDGLMVEHIDDMKSPNQHPLKVLCLEKIAFLAASVLLKDYCEFENTLLEGIKADLSNVKANVNEVKFAI